MGAIVQVTYHVGRQRKGEKLMMRLVRKTKREEKLVLVGTSNLKKKKKKIVKI